MRKRNMLAVVILIAGTAASFYCYTRLAHLIPMGDPDAVSKTEASIVYVNTPMVKKGEGISDVKNDVGFRFTVNGQSYEGGYSIRGRDAAPELDAKVPVVYYTRQPAIFLRAEEYDTLPRQLSALRFMMIAFALAAIIAPFAVMHHKR